MSKSEKLKEKARQLEAKDPKAAINAWLEVLSAQDDEGDPNPDITVFNRVGDLYLKLRDPAEAADFYDKAVDRYAELGFHNNAIAMCNKVLRNAPARQTAYLKLAKLYAAKGFMGEAKQNFLEYAERMQKAGKLQQAFQALREFADISPESEALREMLEEHLKVYGTPERRSGTAAPPPPAAAAPHDDPTKSGKRKTSSLVFLDLGEPETRPGRPGPARVAPPPRSAPPPKPEPEPARESLIEPVTAEPDTSLEIETTSLSDDVDRGGSAGVLEGLESTSADFGTVRLDPGDVRSVRDEEVRADVRPLPELEPTVPEGADEEDADLGSLEETRQPARAPAPRRTPPPAPQPRGSVPKVAPPKASAARAGAPAPAAPGKPKLGKLGAGVPEPSGVKPVVPKRPDPKATEPPKRKTMVEVPPLELEPDFETAETEAGHEVDDEPLAVEEPRPGKLVTKFDAEPEAPPEVGRRPAFIDLGVDGVVNVGGQRGSLVFANIEATPEPATIEDLEARVADDPDDPSAHQALGEALVEAGERGRGILELDHATTGFETQGQLDQAQHLVGEILRLDPNSVRHRQKQVEFAFKSGDKAKLIEAYVELADTLLRSDLPEKARAVYQRVAEHDPTNERAKAALAMLAPAASPPAPPPKSGKRGDAEGKTAPKDAKMKVRHEAVEGGDFIDLGAMILEEELPERNPRMTVADEEPTGDEEQDFQGMLARFKQGIDENIDEADFQSHYDLGIAFKEMGLLDEAIAELQKALRAPEGKLKGSEAIGVCFVEKGAYIVAESILRRGLEIPASGDQERLGILYWLARALEAQGKKPEARELYGRVFAVDIRFIDVGDRVKALAKAK
jgi:tetratricopeptide (TPR) repeat protein